MAQKRMFDKSIISSDSFLEMPDSSQNLYFHLSMNADDDGFVDNWKSIMRMTGHKEDDMKVLISKSFIIPFDTGVIVIKHWRMNNYLRNDRYNETKYLKEKSQLQVEKNQEYTLINNEKIDVVYQLDTNGRHSIEKNSIDNIKENNKKKSYGEFNNVLLTDEEYAKLEKSNLLSYIETLSSYIASKGKKYKSHYATILSWSRRDKVKEKDDYAEYIRV